MNGNRRFVNTGTEGKEIKEEVSLRPQGLNEYIGQQKLKDSIKISIAAAKGRGEALDHLLFYGPPGLGKTTIAGIIANEMGVSIRVTSGPAFERPSDMILALSHLQDNDVLFIDEIHRLNKQIEEILYPAMEDHVVDVIGGKGESEKPMRITLPKFTLIGATTRAGLLSAPLRDRFGEIHRMEFYTPEELKQIIIASAGKLEVPIDDDGAMELARRSRGTPRLANRILKRVRDYAQVRYDGAITYKVAKEVLDILDIDAMGLDRADREFLLMLINNFGGGPAGLDTLAASIGEDAGTIEDVIEPYLLQNGLIHRTPRGRIATQAAYLHLGIAYPGED